MFTTKFDRVLSGDQIDQFLGDSSRHAFKTYAAELDVALNKWSAAANISAIENTGSLRSIQHGAPAVCSLLVDHSGSMRGQRAILATAIVQIVADLWSRLGIRYEILGFTTQSWHGGRSRRKWKWVGRPPKPGRLCDLLHIVYRTIDDTRPGAPWSVRNLNRSELLKENVDGEAIEWAASRLLGQPEARKILIIISDGAPVDDSTLMANDETYLLRHLRSVLEVSKTKGIEIGAIGMGEFVKELYQDHVVIDTPEDLVSLLVPFIARMHGPRQG
ncbi:MAG: hypothetical protein MUE84_12125 [Hyphomonas sp.]|nr:hypothetical protein [Hyphomonas sp.]